MRRPKRTLTGAIADPKVQQVVRACLMAQFPNSRIVPHANTRQNVLLEVHCLDHPPLLAKVPSYGERSSDDHWLLEKQIGKEAKAIRAFAGSGVPMLLHHDQTNRCLVRELIEGMTLPTYVSRIPACDRLNLAVAVIDAVGAIMERAHGGQIPCVLRDIKPDNLIVDKDARIFLVDLGSVRREQDMLSSTRRPERVGSGHWRFWSPEQLLEVGDHLDRRSDYFSTAATAYYILMGSPPFSNSANEHNALDQYLGEYVAVCANLAAIRTSEPRIVNILSWIREMLHPHPQQRIAVCNPRNPNF